MFLIIFLCSSCFFAPCSPEKPHHLLKTPYQFTSLKSVSFKVSSAPFEDLFAEIDRREPSPVLVGLATRLSGLMLPWILPSSA